MNIDNESTKNKDEPITLSVKNDIGMLYVLPDNAQGLGCRDEQQDYFAYNDLFDMDEIVKHGCMAVMADGMGGLQNGRDAAIAGVDEFLRCYPLAIDEGMSISEALECALVSANRAVLDFPNAGATMIATVVANGCLHWVSVGDSHMYLFRNGCLRLLNKEHTYAKELDEMVRNGEISEEQAINNAERKALTSYLGLPEITLVDEVVDYRLLPKDLVLLCSDGLFNTLSESEISEVLASDDEEKAERLVRSALLKQNIQQDNVTAVLLKII